MKATLYLFGVFALSVFGCLCLAGVRFLSECTLTAHTIRETAAKLPDVLHVEAEATRATVNAANAQWIAQAEAARNALNRTLDASVKEQGAALNATLNHQGDAYRGTLDSQLTAARSDAKPVIEQAAALLKDTQDTEDALYPDVSAGVQSVDVAARAVAETATTVQNATPKLTEAAQANADNFKGITADVHTFTSQATKPKTLGGKIWGGLKIAAELALHLH